MKIYSSNNTAPLLHSCTSRFWSVTLWTKNGQVCSILTVQQAECKGNIIRKMEKNWRSCRNNEEWWNNELGMGNKTSLYIILLFISMFSMLIHLSTERLYNLVGIHNISFHSALSTATIFICFSPFSFLEYFLTHRTEWSSNITEQFQGTVQ